MSQAVPCPSCSEPLPASPRECPGCALPLTGPYAARLWQVDQQLGALRLERVALIARLREGDGTTPAPPPAHGPRQRTWSGQQLLLGGGVALVLVAAVVFIAVAWSLLGVGGQVAVMVSATVAAAAASRALAGRGLRATAEAVGLLSVGLAVLDTVAARTLDLAGLATVDGAGYLAGSAALVAAACAALARHRTRLMSFTVSGLAAAAVVPGAFLVALDPSTDVVGAAFLLGAGAGFVILARTAPEPWRGVRAVPAVVAGGYLLIGISLCFAIVDEEALLGEGAVATLLLALTVGSVWGWSLAPRRPAAEALLGVAGGAVVSALTLVLLAGHADGTGRAALVAVAVAAVLAALVARGESRRVDAWLAVLATGHLAAVVAVAVSAGEVYADHPHRGTGTLASLTLLLAVGATATAARAGRPLVRAGFAAYGAAAALGAAAVVTTGATGDVTTATVALTTAVALVTAGVAGFRLGQAEELALAAVAAVGLLGAAVAATSLDGVLPLAAVLAAGGLVALAYAVLPGRGLLSVAGVLGCSGATWVLTADAGITVVEAYSLPLAALAAVVGGVRYLRDPRAASWTTVGPALSAALLPSALATIDDPGLLRPLLVLGVGAAVVTIAVLLRWQAPLVTGTVALLVVAASQLAPYAIGMPRYLSLGSVGLVLLLLGARYEQSRRDARQTVAWVRALR